MYVLLYFFTIFLMTLFPVAYRPGMAAVESPKARGSTQQRQRSFCAIFAGIYHTCCINRTQHSRCIWCRKRILHREYGSTPSAFHGLQAAVNIAVKIRLSAFTNTTLFSILTELFSGA